MTSMGEISAASTTIAGGSAFPALAAAVLDFRRDLTTSLTPRFRVLFLVAVTVLQ